MLTCSVRHGLVTSNRIQISFSLKLPFFSRRTPGSKATKNIVWRRSRHSKRSKHPSRWAKHPLDAENGTKSAHQKHVEKGPAKTYIYLSKHTSTYQHPPSCSVDRLTNHQNGVYFSKLFDVWLLLTFVSGSHGQSWCTKRHYIISQQHELTVGQTAGASLVSSMTSATWKDSRLMPTKRWLAHYMRGSSI